jgi:hypothetical protein
MSAMSQKEYQPTYRQKDVDGTLENHETRISRLEKAGLVAVGYAAASGYDIVGIVTSVL